LGIFAGVKLIVILFNGNLKPLEIIADLTLSVDSQTDLSGSPTIERDGYPFEDCTSTVTGMHSIPCMEKLFVLKNPILPEKVLQVFLRNYHLVVIFENKYKKVKSDLKSVKAWIFS